MVAAAVVLDLPIECRTGLGPDVVRLGKKERRGPYGAAQHPVPQLVRRRHLVVERDAAHLDVDEPGVLEELDEQALVGIPEERRPATKLDRRPGSDLANSAGRADPRVSRDRRSARPTKAGSG